MEVTTVTTRRSPQGAKQFAWSYSRLKNFETCPKRYYEIDVAKTYKESSEQLDWGDEVHKKAAARIKDGTPLPDTMGFIEPWIARILDGSVGSRIFVEQKFAINRAFGPTDFFAPDVWFRSICDVLKVNGDVALAIDWKTGKIIEDGIQLALVAACVFAHFPEVNYIRTKFIWLKDDADTKADFSRAQMAEVWRGLLPRVDALELATKNMDFPPKPGRLCRRYCPVTKCPHHGS